MAVVSRNEIEPNQSSSPSPSVTSSASSSLWSLNQFLLPPNIQYYKLFRKLDRDVWQSKYHNTQYNVAIKTTNLETVDNENMNDAINAIRVTRSIKHENILPFLSCFVEQNQLFVVMPFCEYGSVADICRPSGLKEAVISHVVKDVLKGLSYLHSHGFIHRAIKGSHVLVSQTTGQCTLTGLNYSTSVIIDGKWMQTIHEFPSNCRPNLNWLSPELLEQNLLGYDFRSDIYSVGITCCEMANGFVPFEDMAPTDMLLDKLTGNFPRILDSTCPDLLNISTEGMSNEDKTKYNDYRKRRFSDGLHSFTSDLCMNFDPQKRPSAMDLLNHSFIKQTKKSNLLKLLPELKFDTKQSDDLYKYNEPNVTLNKSNEDVSWNFT